MGSTHRPEEGAGVADADLAGRTALVTGATSGVGREIALALGRLGADVLVHGRNRERGDRVVDGLRDLGADASFVRAEFTDLDQVEALAADVADHVAGLDLLVNNAGTHFDSGDLVDLGAGRQGDEGIPDGSVGPASDGAARRVERTFVANHLAPFLLTNRLREVIAADGRIVTVSSEVHRRADLDLDAVTSVGEYDGFGAYGRSKLANVLFVRELARRLDGRTAVACHPGFVPGSGLWRHASLPVRAVMGVLERVPRSLTFGVVDSAATAAETPVFLAAAPDATSSGATTSGATADGAYFRDCERVEPAPQARDDDLASRLWEWSAAAVDL